jgi:hypothetical protein
MSQKVTEKEAKEKWCRHGFIMIDRADHEGGRAASANRRNEAAFPMLAKCLGSGCMDWEWASGPDINNEGKPRVGFCDAQRGL